MRKIKVLELIDGGFLGGGQINILSLVKNINKDKFDVNVAARGSGKFEKLVSETGIPFYSFELPKVLRHKYLRHLQSLHNREKFDIVHSHGGVGGFYGRLLKKHNPEIKTIHTIHGIHYLNKEGFFEKNISKSIEQYLVQFTDITICLTKCDFKTAVENKIADQKKTVIINNGIDIKKFSESSSNFVLLKELGLSPDDFVVGNVSRFDIQKNQKLIIQASYYLSKKYPEMKFVLVGEGKLFKKMKVYARDSHLDDVVIFAGERENLADFYSIFDVFVLPSFWEGMPYVLLEAMAAKLPIVCSNLPNHLEIIKNNHSAFTINPHEMDDLYQRLIVLYENPELRKKLGDNAFKDVQKFDIKDSIKRVEKIYEEVMGV
jgi:glycosyltransferase involved in cell wall biosynthesis